MENRILIYAPTGQDGPLASHVLALAHLDNHVCATLAELAEQIALGVGAVLTVEEALPPGGYKLLHDHVARQQDWSDLPILLLTHHGADSPTVRKAVAGLGNLSLLERPVRTLTLITALQATLRARSKQYQVREAARRKDEFLASLGHELRNPLAPIRTSVSLLTHLYPDAAPVARIRDMVERQVKLLTRLVDDLLDVARISQGKLTLQLQHIELHAVMESAVETVQPMLQSRAHHLSLELPTEPLWINGDPVRLAQAIGNLLHNAAKFTNRGGQITLRVSTLPGQRVSIAVHDNGIGITSYNLPRIFNMFAQGATAHDRVHDGLGIGLSLVSTLAHMHGGSVHASSPGIDQGSSFELILPLLSPAASTAAGPTPEPAAMPAMARTPGNGGRRLLLVDDNLDSSEVMGELLTAMGHEVYLANDADRALALARAHQPDVIILDIGMPKVDGYALARMLRAEPAFAHTRLIAHTGFGSAQDRQKTRDAGFDFHLVKPANFDDLERSLRSA